MTNAKSQIHNNSEQFSNPDLSPPNRSGQLLAAVNALTQQLLEAERWQDALGPFLATLGQASQAGRAYLYWVSPLQPATTVRLTGWTAEGVDDAAPVAAASILGLEPFAPHLAQRQPVWVSRTEAPPAIADFWPADDVAFLIVAPVAARGQVWALLELHDLADRQPWSAAEVAVIQSAANILGSVISRQQNEQILSHFFETDLIGMAVTSLEKGWVNVNERLCKILGYPKAELLTKTWTELTYPDDIAPDVAQFNKLLAGEKDMYAMDKRFIRKDGSVTHAHIVAQAIRRPDGSISHFLALVQDINHRVQTLSALEAEIEQRRRLEAALGNTEKRFRAILETAPDFIVVIDRCGRYLLVNRVAEGLTLDQVLNSTVYDFTPIDYHDTVRAALHQVFSEGRPTTYELSAPGLDGGMAWYLNRIGPIQENGETVAATIISTDITARKRAELELEHIFTRSADMQGLAGFDGYYKRLNPAWEKTLGWSSEELMSRPYLEFVHEEDRAATLEAAALLSQGALVTQFENRYRCRDGTYRRLSWIATPIPENSLIIATARDITQERAMQAAIQKSEARFRHLAEYAPVGIYESQRDGKIIYVNPALARLLHYPSVEAVSQSLTTDHYKRRQDRDRFLEQLEAQGVVTDFETELVTVDGQTKHVLLSAALRDDMLLGTMVDITARKRAEEQLKQTLQTLEESNQELQQFAYVASHDLQEPLRMVSSYLELLQKRYQGQLDERADLYIYYAVDGAIRMKTLISDLLAYSRITTRSGTRSETDMNQILYNVVKNLQFVIRDTAAEITHDPLPILIFDSTQLAQLLQNLISNAIKFRGEEPPRIHIGVRRQAGEWVISVCDNGIGIEPEFQEQIFVVFKRLHSRDQYEGTGIGLAICKRIVERHGGRLWVESQPGQGATFYFTVPVDGGQGGNLFAPA